MAAITVHISDNLLERLDIQVEILKEKKAQMSAQRLNPEQQRKVAYIRAVKNEAAAQEYLHSEGLKLQGKIRVSRMALVQECIERGVVIYEALAENESKKEEAPKEKLKRKF